MTTTLKDGHAMNQLKMAPKALGIDARCKRLCLAQEAVVAPSCKTLCCSPNRMGSSQTIYF